MNKEALKKAVELGQELGRVFVATADSQGLPHVAAAGEIRLESETRVGISAWFCPGTVANLKKNPHMASVVWDPASDVGYQIVGRCEKVEEVSMMNGYSPQTEEKQPIPQVERKILMRVEKVIGFKHAPHSDLEE